MRCYSCACIVVSFHRFLVRSSNMGDEFNISTTLCMHASRWTTSSLTTSWGRKRQSERSTISLANCGWDGSDERWRCWAGLVQVRGSFSTSVKASDIRLAAPSCPVPLGLPPISPNAPVSIKQVEFNMISVLFGCLSQRVVEVAEVSRAVSGLSTALTSYRYLWLQRSITTVHPTCNLSSSLKNDTIAGLAGSLAEAHQVYGGEGYDFSCVRK